jgi:sporulation protein YlmC with PRC-barrel domain
VKLSDFEMLEIVTEEGRSLGHVFDLRAHGRPTTTSTQAMGPVDKVVYGTLGLLERLGVRRVAGRTLKWDRVVAIRAGKIVVRA